MDGLVRAHMSILGICTTAALRLCREISQGKVEPTSGARAVTARPGWLVIGVGRVAAIYLSTVLKL